ncbi:pectate lyase [Paenibacillus sp. N4]|uniref:pectate lyase n=1 Tax=Paenibacillus vietnamensis TaxID=2590547 RepID=UPI001CD0D75F|nr:pectate lyase [Paenibacillus vietnamensis]MCA0756697.1 pectate lyase [Paenibacillus vietnamensis]
MNRTRQASKLAAGLLASVMAVSLLSSAWPSVGYAEENSQITEEAQGGIYEAEDAAGSGTIVDNKHFGFTGTGFVDFNPNVSGGWIEWTVEVPAAGDYTLAFRYASGAAEDRPAEIKVNGTVVAPQLGFPSTGDFAVWKTVSANTSLNAGTNVIRATAVGTSGGANIDHLQILNQSDTEEPAPVVLEEVEVSDIIGGLLMKKLNTLGILAKELAADQPIARISFMSLLNDTLGYVQQDTFKNLDQDGAVWEKPLDEWDAYVLAATKEAGYIAPGEDGLIHPEEPLLRSDAANMIAKALDLIPDSASGSSGIGAAIREGYMSAKGGFGKKDFVTAAEAKEIATAISSKTEGAEQISIVGVHAVASNVVAVTLNSPLVEIDYKDIVLNKATGTWKSFNPAFKNLTLKKAAAGTNRFGNTVLLFETAEELGEDATIANETAAGGLAGDLNEAIAKAENLLSWQMDHGGWTKAMPYDRAWNGVEKKSSQLGIDGVTELGTIDNNSTINELRFISQVYRATGDERFKTSVRKGIGFLLTMQYETGGWPQVYPQRGGYSDYVTFNDNAMINVMDLIDDIAGKRYPFDTDLIDGETVDLLEQAREKGIEYILKSQINVDGQLTAWCAQHDPITYEPRHARAYEHPSISGSESVGIIRYLLSYPNQTAEIKRSVEGALQWFDKVKLEGIRYVSADPNGVYFVEDPSAVSWYRFYEIGTNKGIFSGRDGIIKYSIQEIEQERRDGYSWGGSYAKNLLATMKTIGYYSNRVYAEAAAANSKDAGGRKLNPGELKQVKDLRGQIRELPSQLTVAQDGTGDYSDIQAAVDAVQPNNTERVNILVKKGIYKQVVTVPANKPFISMIGESSEDTVITYDNYSGRERPAGGTYGTSGSASMFVNGNDFIAKNMTIENSFDEASVNAGNKQAVALNVRGERQRFENVRFIGNQDTLLTNGGTQYFYQCYIEGDVDFIFGGSRAVFEECTIHSLDRGSSTNNGYITAASTMITEPYGYLFLNSKLTSNAAAGTVWLGRPWHPGGNPDAIASVVYMNCEMGAHINPIGWTDMSGFSAADARFYEYNSSGPGAAAADTRRQLTDEQAESWTVSNVLKGWNPNQEA